MSLLVILILHSTSDKAGPTFVNVGDNHNITLSRQAKQILRKPSFVILGVGPSNATAPFFNNLIRGRVADPFAPGFFTEDADANARSPEFPFYAELDLGRFCRLSNITCNETHSNVTIAFVTCPGSGDEDVRWTSAALAPISLLSILVPFSEPGSNAVWEWFPMVPGHRVLMAGAGSERTVAVVFPDMAVPGVTTNSTAREYNAARTAMNARHGASLRRFLCSDRAFAFVEPDAGRWGNAYWDFQREIAGLIVRLAGEIGPRLPDDSVEQFEWSVGWFLEHGKQLVGEYFPARAFLDWLAQKRLNRALKSVVQKSVDGLKSVLLQGFRVFEVDSTASALQSETIEAAMKEVRDVPEAAEPSLPEFVAARMAENSIEILRWILYSEIPPVVEKRRSELKEEFGVNCSRTSMALVNASRRELSWWPGGTGVLEAEWTTRFSEAVVYKELPSAMQEAVGPIYESCREVMTQQLHSEIRWIRGTFVIINLVLIGVVMWGVLMIVRLRCRRPWDTAISIFLDSIFGPTHFR
jgi:hypothetical protein